MTATSPAAGGRSTQEFTRELFSRVDALDAAHYARLFAPTGRLSFANNPPPTRPETIERSITGFFATIAGVHHTVVADFGPVVAEGPVP